MGAQRGEMLSHYRLLERIGAGGMGIVYLAEDLRLQRQVALKILQPGRMSDPELRQRFLREARAAAAIDHPNVCTIHEVDEIDGQHFIVMELIRGHRLRDRLSEFSGNVPLLVDVAAQIASGLAEAHSRGIIHRDLSSANVMLTEKDLAKVMDFGLATRRFQPGVPGGPDPGATGEISITAPGITVGTVAFLSPEQARGRDVDPRSDIFSLGILLYEMATGSRPFTGAGTVEIIDAILHAEPLPPTHLNPSIPSALEHIICKALRKEPGERYQRTDDLLADLRSLKRQIDSGPLAASLGRTGAPKRLTLRAGVAIAVAMLALVGSTLAILVGIARTRGFATPPVAAAARRAALAVFPFENQTGNANLDWYGNGAAEWLAVDLSKLPTLDLVSSHRLQLAARALPQSQATVTLDPARAAEIAERAGATHFLLGATLKIGTDVFVRAEVVEVTTGKVVSAHRITGITETNLIAKLKELTELLRQDLQSVS